MRVIVLGGTWFVGRAITEALVSAGHSVLIVHRGISEPSELSRVRHLHADRGAWSAHRAAFSAFTADAAVDVSAGNAAGARAALSVLPPGIRLIALSSVDVYRAYEALRTGTQSDAVPLTEESALRSTRHLDGPQWENLEIEEAYLRAGATILRLGAVYGEHDYQHRFEPVLRRVRAGRQQLPVGTGTFLFSRVYAGDVAQAVLAALASDEAFGQCLNIVEAQTAPMRLFYEQVIGATGGSLDLVRVPDETLPSDLQDTGALSQHLLASPARAVTMLGWRDTAGPEILTVRSAGISRTRPPNRTSTSQPTMPPWPAPDSTPASAAAAQGPPGYSLACSSSPMSGFLTKKPRTGRGSSRRRRGYSSDRPATSPSRLSTIRPMALPRPNVSGTSTSV
jgi:nucleoside-diphosphate-sugar epimerase